MEIRAGRTYFPCWTKHFGLAPKLVRSSGLGHWDPIYFPNVMYYLLPLSIEQFLFIPVQPSVHIAERFKKRLTQDEVERGPFPKGNNFLVWVGVLCTLVHSLTSIILFFQCSPLFYCFGENGCDATLLHLIW